MAYFVVHALYIRCALQVCLLQSRVGDHGPQQTLKCAVCRGNLRGLRALREHDGHANEVEELERDTFGTSVVQVLYFLNVGADRDEVGVASIQILRLRKKQWSGVGNCPTRVLSVAISSGIVWPPRGRDIVATSHILCEEYGEVDGAVELVAGFVRAAAPVVCF